MTRAQYRARLTGHESHDTAHTTPIRSARVRMSKDAFIKFYNVYVPSKPELMQAIDSVNTNEDFAKLALEHGPKNGFDFTRDEMIEVMEASRAKMLKSAELSPAQLD